MDLFMKLLWAGVLVFFIWRMVPMAKDWLENGPRGSSREWLTTSMLLGGVVLFVVLLMMMVRG